MNSMRFCTWAKTPNSPELDILKESTRRVGIVVDVMPCSGFLEKPVALKKYVSTLSETEIVLCTDGYDVLYTQTEQDILAGFLGFNASLVFSGEKSCYHHFPESKNYFERTGAPGLYRYLNSGLMIGYAGAYQSMLKNFLDQQEELKSEFNKTAGTVGFFNDQTIYGRYACLNPGKVTIDTKARLFWTMTSEKYDINRYTEFSSNGIGNLESNTRPSLVHVSHLDKFYLVYLYIAHKLGIELKEVRLKNELLRKLLIDKANIADNERIKIDSEFSKYLTKICQNCDVQIQGCEKIAIIFIGTGRYIEYFQKFYDTSRKHFVANTPKTYFVFTDDTSLSELNGRDCVVPVETAAEAWPLSTLFRFRYINLIHKQLTEFSHIVYIDADMFFCSRVSEGEFFAHDKPLFGVQHPGNYLIGHAPYEMNSQSSASVAEGDDTSTYWQGCFWGGQSKDIFKLSRELARRIDSDLSRDVIARWHDESHLNKYFLENRSLVHTYDPGYAYPEALNKNLRDKLLVEKKIVHVAKNHKNMRSSQKKSKTMLVDRPEGGSRRISDGEVLTQMDGFKLEKTATSFVLQYKKNQSVAKLNETSAQLWNLCVGDFSIGDIVKIFSAIHSISPENVRRDIFPALNEFLDKGLLRKIVKIDLRDNTKPGIRFFSFANNIKAKQLSVLKESASLQGIEICFLGDGLNRFSTTMKPKLLYERLRGLDDNDIVCALDGFEVFLCAGEEKIKRRFLAMNCDCVISAERAYSHQYKKYKSIYDNVQTQSPYRYLNSGSIVGYAGALRKMCAPTLSTRVQSKIFTAKSINKIKKWSSTIAKAVRFKSFDRNFIYSYAYYTDQQHIGRYVASNPDNLKILLDYDTRLFWCCAWEWKDIQNHFRIEGNHIINNHTNNSPLMIHVPGWRVHGKVFSDLYEIQQSLNK